MISSNEFVHKDKIKIKATSNIKIYQVFSYLCLIDVGIYLLDGPFSGDVGIVNLDRIKGTHWVLYVNENFFIVMVVRNLIILFCSFKC